MLSVSRSPTTTKALLDARYIVNVERSPGRAFGDGEFEAVGATLVPEGSWVGAPKDHIIIGLKELPEDNGTPPALSMALIIPLILTLPSAPLSHPIRPLL